MDKHKCCQKKKKCCGNRKLYDTTNLNSIKKFNIILLGAPGSGKGTQTKRFIEDEYKVISIGDLLRDEIKSGSDFGNKIKKLVESGKLVDDDIIGDLVQLELNKLKIKEGIVFDGYPRTIKQANMLDDLLNKMKINLDAVFELNIDDHTIIQRTLDRLICPNCKAVYNRKGSEAPKVENICDVCGTELKQRSDDTPEIIKNRLDTYYKEVNDIIKHFKKKNKHFTVDVGHGTACITNYIIQNILNNLKSF
jgi:adenylate kinase